MKKILMFSLAGLIYEVNEAGEIKANGLPAHSKSWKFRGGIKHHASSAVSVDLKKAFEKPELLNKCLFSDVDGGTTRIHMGRHNGKLPRISGACVVKQ